MADMASARCKHFYCKARAGLGLCRKVPCAAWCPAWMQGPLLRTAAPLPAPAPPVQPRWLGLTAGVALQDCWAGYVHTAIDSGPSCLDLRCPDPGCRRAELRAASELPTRLSRCPLAGHLACNGADLTRPGPPLPGWWPWADWLALQRLLIPVPTCHCAECKAAVPQTVIAAVADTPHKQR